MRQCRDFLGRHDPQEKIDAKWMSAATALGCDFDWPSARTWPTTTLRNMTLAQRRLLPEILLVNLFDNPSRVAVPVHCVFGEQDALTSAAMVKQSLTAISAPASTVVRAPTPGTWCISTVRMSCDRS